MQTLLGNSPSELPYAERLQALAGRKLAEVEALIAQAQTMKTILEAGLKCECLRLEDCLGCCDLLGRLILFRVIDLENDDQNYFLIQCLECRLS